MKNLIENGKISKGIAFAFHEISKYPKVHIV